MADYKGQTRTPYTNALEAARKAQEAQIAASVCASITEQIEQPEAPKKHGRPFKAKD